MKTIKTISVTQICSQYDIPVSFIDSLNNYELIKLSSIDNQPAIYEEEIELIEKLIRLHYHLNINFEGLDVVVNLLNQIEDLKSELNTLQNKLYFYR